MRAACCSVTAAALSALLLPAPSPAQYQCRPRSVYYASPYSYHYQQAYYAAPAYHDPHVVLVPKAVEVYASPDYYASVRDYFRDALLADAIAYRLMTNQPRGGPPAPLPSRPDSPPAGGRTAEPALKTAVAPALQKIVTESCVKCHQGPGAKKGVDLSDLSSVPWGVRWACHGAVNAGDMPPGGQPLPDESVRPFYEWAKQGSQALAQARKGG